MLLKFFLSSYNDNVKVLKPQDNLFIPSDAEYRKVLRINAEPVPGPGRCYREKSF